MTQLPCIKYYLLCSRINPDIIIFTKMLFLLITYEITDYLMN